MLNGVPLLLCCTVQVHIIPHVLHNKPLKFLDTPKLHHKQTIRSATTHIQQRNTSRSLSVFPTGVIVAFVIVAST
jgi:hypothetical protein